MSTDLRVAIWRSTLLPASETFVRRQADALTRWQPTLVGAVKVDSHLAADTDVMAFADGPPGWRAFQRLRLTGGSARLRAALTDVRPDLIHAHFGGDGWLISRTAHQLGVPLVITLHGRDVTVQANAPGVRGARYRRNLRTAFARSAVILAVSESIRDKAIDLGADPATVLVHHIGVPMPPALPPDASATAKTWDVAFVGRFVEKKGIDDLIEAVGLLPPPRPRLVLIGDGPLSASMRERAAALGLDATFLGVQDPPAVARCLTAAKVLAAPSKTAANGDTEGLPTTILEAASLGLPVVSTYHSGIPEAVIAEQTGLLVAEGDRRALAAGIQRLLADNAVRDRMGRQARRHVATNFDIGHQTALLEDIYDSVARARQPATSQPRSDDNHDDHNHSDHNHSDHNHSDDNPSDGSG
jgi:colanic acid/amylovoran biosynthesis glycosyltransferase